MPFRNPSISGATLRINDSCRGYFHAVLPMTHRCTTRQHRRVSECIGICIAVRRLSLVRLREGLCAIATRDHTSQQTPMVPACERRMGVHGYACAGTSSPAPDEPGCSAAPPPPARRPSPARGDTAQVTLAPDEEIGADGRRRRIHPLLHRIRGEHLQDRLVLDDHDRAAAVGEVHAAVGGDG